MLKRILAVLVARNKEFLRDRATMAWNFLFPILVVMGFAFAFSKGSQTLFKVGVYPSAALTSSSHPFLSTAHIQFVPLPSLTPALEKVKRHQLDMVVSLEGSPFYWINTSSPKGYLLEKILLGSSSTPSASLKKTVEGQEIRYVDWLIAGLLAMNMMFSALFGVGYTLVRYRKNGFLKRLKATPLKAHEFLTAQILSRLSLILLVSTLTFGGCHAIIHFQMLGSWWHLFLVWTAGAMCLISLGLFLACRVTSEELAGGLINLTVWPMMFLSGVWFSLEGTHPWIQRASQFFPLTHVIESARAIMTEGAGLEFVLPRLAILGTMTLVFLVAGATTFRWE